MRGRKPKPIPLRKLEGNPGKRPLGKRGAKSGVGAKRPTFSGFPGTKTLPGGKDRKDGKTTPKASSAGILDKISAKDIPVCPAWMSDAAKREWRRVVPLLKRLKLLNAVDRTALSGYCQSYARYVEAEKEIQEHGILMETENGYMASPRVAVAQKYLQICKAFCVEFGMTPSARGRMVTGGEGEGGEGNILD